MPLDSDVDAESGLVLVEAVGVVPLVAYLDLWEELIEDPRVASGPVIVAP